MDDTALAVIAASLFLWALLSARLGRADVTAPMTFLVLGMGADAFDIVDLDPGTEAVKLLAEVTLVLLLFADAARVELRALRHDATFPGRLLLIGLPLTVGAGALLAQVLFPDIDVWFAILIGACLAPTDAGLGSVIVTDRSVPARIRRTLNVESGLNDGIVAPLITFALAMLVQQESGGEGLAASAARELTRGTVVGIAVGAGGGFLLVWASSRKWTDQVALPIGALALAVFAYAGAISVHGNGFVAAFVGGLAFGPFGRRLSRPATGDRPPSGGEDEEDEPLLGLTELAGQLGSAAVWFLFGALAVGQVVDDLTWEIVVYAVASLTVIRMVPVAVALLGMGLQLPTIAFVGWFGPRGMASLVFALLAIDSLGTEGDLVLDVVTLTAFLSVLAHGTTARPLASRYGRWARAAPREHPALAPAPDFQTRRTIGGSEADS